MARGGNMADRDNTEVFKTLSLKAQKKLSQWQETWKKLSSSSSCPQDKPNRYLILKMLEEYGGGSTLARALNFLAHPRRRENDAVRDTIDQYKSFLEAHINDNKRIYQNPRTGAGIIGLLRKNLIKYHSTTDLENKSKKDQIKSIMAAMNPDGDFVAMMEVIKQNTDNNLLNIALKAATITMPHTVTGVTVTVVHTVKNTASTVADTVEDTLDDLAEFTRAIYQAPAPEANRW